MADVNSIISSNRSFAESAIFAAEGAINAVENQISAADFSTIFEPTVDPAEVLDQILSGEKPDEGDLAELSQFTEELEVPENEPTLDDLPDLYDPEFQDIEKAPGISLSGLFDQNLPPAFGETAPGEPSGINAPIGTTIKEPTINTISDPTINAVTIPKFDAELKLPGFDEEGPTAPPETPEDLDRLFNDTYDRMIPEMKAFVDGCVDGFIDKFAPGNRQRMQDLEDRVSAYLAGGTGLNPVVEQAIYDRGRGRVQEENRAAESVAWDQAAQRGYTLPPGQLTRELRRSGNDGANRNGQIAMDIVKLQADLEQKNLQFAVQQAITLRTQIRNAAIQYAGTLLQVNRDALDYAQAVVDNVIKIYDLAVRAWQTSVQYLESRIRLYEARLRAALAEVDLFEAKVRAAGLEVQVNQQQVETFKARIEAQRAKIELFASQIQAAQLEIQRRQGLIAVYQGQVQAFSAKVQAKTAEFGAYEAAIRGDEAVVRAEIAKINAYQAETQGIATRNDAELKKQQATAERNRTLIAQYQAEVQAWLATFEADKESYASKVTVHQDAIRAYQDLVARQTAFYQLEQAQLNATVQAQAQLVSAEAQAFRGSIQGRIGKVTAKVNAAVASAQIQGAQAAGAVAAQNTLVQVVESQGG